MSLPPPGDQISRTRQLAQLVNRAVRVYRYRGIRLRIDRDVFPPDFGFTSRLLADVLAHRPVARALDMGTGTLFLALMMRKAGSREVWAADVHAAAIRCAQRNLAANPSSVPIHIIQSDLFSALPAQLRFDLMVFNQPYYPIRANGFAGLGADGGQVLIHRFLADAPRYLADHGEILMPWSTLAGMENHPARIARRLGWLTSMSAYRFEYPNLHVIYSIRRPARSQEDPT